MEVIREHDAEIRKQTIDEFAIRFIEEGKKRKYLRHIWIEQTCKMIAEQMKGETEHGN